MEVWREITNEGQDTVGNVWNEELGRGVFVEGFGTFASFHERSLGRKHDHSIK
jgi:hypothetical protein